MPGEEDADYRNRHGADGDAESSDADIVKMPMSMRKPRMALVAVVPIAVTTLLPTTEAGLRKAARNDGLIFFFLQEGLPKIL